MSERLHRRSFLATTALAAEFLAVRRRCRAQPAAFSGPDSSRVRGMLIGSLIGDAAGGPVEFASPDKVRSWLPATRDWEDHRRLDAREIQQLSRSFRLLPYTELRPAAAPYAHWTERAEAGTVTDDSRHKFMLLAALRTADAASKLPIGPRELAEQYLRYGNTDVVRSHEAYGPLCEEWLREYCQAARWVTGSRDPAVSAPAERLWGGVPTNAGQMVLLPLAGAYAGDPEAAYRAAFVLGFMDNGTAKDLNAAVVAGLAAAIGDATSDTADERWQLVRSTMLTVDPFRYGQVPWVPRPTTRWLHFAERAAAEADGSPKQLFEILERDAEPRFHWDAHFVLASVWSILKLCDFDGLAALQLCLDFGHDTDSAAQLAGAFVGAVHGHDVFDESVRSQVELRLREDYGESVDEWVELLVGLQGRAAVAAG